MKMSFDWCYRSLKMVEDVEWTEDKRQHVYTISLSGEALAKVGCLHMGWTSSAELVPIFILALYACS